MSRKLSRSEVAVSFVAVGLAFAAYARGHEDWVDAAVVVSLVTGFLVEPLLVFAHELGHALAAVALTGERVLIRVGGEPYLVRFALGKIDVRFHPSGYVARCELSPARISPRHYLVVALAGPAVSLAVGAVLVPVALAWRGDSPVLFWITALAAASSLFVGLANAVPFRRLPGWWPGSMRTHEEGPSDGFLALHALRAQRHGEDGVWPEDRSSDSDAMRLIVTDAVRRVIAMAVDEAEGLRNPCVGTEHLLLGLLRERESRACRVLESFGLTTERVRVHLARSPGEHETASGQELPLTPAAKRTLARARRALSLQGDECVDTKHVLLGLLQEQEGQAMQLLAELSVDSSQLRREAMLALQEGTKPGSLPPKVSVPGSARGTGG